MTNLASPNTLPNGDVQDPDDACANTDTHLWPIVSCRLCRAVSAFDKMSKPQHSIHATADGGIGINCGGLVIVKTLREWHALAAKDLPKFEPK